MADYWRNYKWLKKVSDAIAYRYAWGDKALLEELSQEGAIEGWKVLETAKKKALVRLAVERRIIKCATEGRRLGSEKKRWDRHRQPKPEVISRERLIEAGVPEREWDVGRLDEYPSDHSCSWLTEAIPRDDDLTVAVQLGLGYSQVEIASGLGVSEAAVRWRIKHRIRPAIATYLEREAA